MSLVLQSDLLLGVLRAAPAAGSSAAARKLGVASSDAGDFARTLPPHESSGASDLIMGVLSAGSPERRQAAAAVLKAADTVEAESRQDKAYAGLEATLARNLFEAMIPQGMGEEGESNFANGIWRSMAVDQYASLFVERGGLGLARELPRFYGQDAGGGSHWPYFEKHEIKSFET